MKKSDSIAPGMDFNCKKAAGNKGRGGREGAEEMNVAGDVDAPIDRLKAGTKIEGEKRYWGKQAITDIRSTNILSLKICWRKGANKDRGLQED